MNSTGGVYTYDYANQRSKKVAGGNTTYYVYGLNGLLYGEYDSSGDFIREYVYLNDEPLAQIDDVSSSDVLTYLHTDHLGTPRFGTNTSGTQVWSWANEAFGTGATSGSVIVNLRMPGQYFDSESNLFYNWNRYYNPEIGRYISSDPIGLAGGMNTFNYANVSPLMYSDPRGLDAGAISIPLVTGICVIIGAYYYDTCIVNAEENASICPGQWYQDGPQSFPEPLYNKPPKDAKDPTGAKAPGKPGAEEGFKDPKSGEQWVKDPGGRGYGWKDSKGNIWIPTGPAGSPGTGTSGPAHGGPHWDVQKPGGGYVNVRPGQKLP